MLYKKAGWFTTARDLAALELLQIVISKIKEGFLPLEISYVFVSKERGESEISDKLINYAESEGLRVITFSALGFEKELRKGNRELWRKRYHEEVLKRLPEEVDFGVLAGYMWVVSEEMCKKLNLINLHPALPGGPKGTWQEVIWQIISARGCETGIMMHKVTPELDEGPALSFVRFPIRTEEFKKLWEEAEQILLKHHLSGLQKLQGESCRLFKKIREEGVKRELPLIVYTLKYLAEGKISFDDENLPVDLSEEVENFIRSKL
jgi:phosphoribosylglycinamide formyltransferase-1